jgi:hypothetical protein
MSWNTNTNFITLNATMNSLSVSNITVGSIYYTGNLIQNGISTNNAITTSNLVTTNITSSNISSNNISIGILNVVNEIINTSRISTRLDIGGIQPSFSSNTIGQLFLTGNFGSATGPHILMNTSQDIYPTVHLLNFTHDNISLNFDSYFDGSSYKTSSTYTGFQMYKTANQLQFTYANGSAGSGKSFTTAMCVGSTGNIGINTVAPNYNLDISGTCRFTNNLYLTSGAIYPNINITTGTSFLINVYGGNMLINGPLSLGGYNINAGGGTFGNIFSNGTNVGIGTTSPTNNVHVLSNSFGAITLEGNIPDVSYRVKNTGTNGRSWLVGSGSSGGSASGNFYIFDETGGQFRMCIGSTGNIGIGTQTPTVPLHVTFSSSLSVNGGYFFNASTSVITAWSTSIQPLSIAATQAILTGTNFLASSDIRIKNICDEKINLNLIDNINPVIYTYKDRIKNPKKNIGFIAQNIIECCPEAVTLHPEIIPDIMKLVKILENNDSIITIKNEWNVNKDTIIKIMVDENDISGELVTVIYADKDIIKFTFEKMLKEKVFIYGRQVSDFHELNYDYIFALGFAGIKESRKNIIDLKQQVNELQALVKTLIA